MPPGEPIDIERELAQAHLLIMRGAYSKAHAQLALLSRFGVPAADIDPLLDLIRQRQDQTKQDSERRRAWRYNLQLQAWTARVGWFLAAVALAVYAGWNGIIAIGMGCD